MSTVLVVFRIYVFAVDASKIRQSMGFTHYGGSFFIQIHVPRTYDPGFRFFVKQSSKQEKKKKKKRSKFVFSCKNGLKWW